MAQALVTLREKLLAHRNPDGGWGYSPGKASRIEPTCWALLAISRAANQQIEVEVLRRWPRQNGWLVDVAGAPVNYAFNALAALAQLPHPKGRDESVRIATQLLDIRGVAFAQNKEIRQDNSLQAWPWIDSTFSWVEPTSLCLLLVKKLRSALPSAPAADRIAIGERMLIDRACQAGGWNYGGSNVYGQELFAYVPTTALALLALQDRPKEPAVAKALGWLQTDAQSEPSAHALALALIALNISRAPAPVLDNALRKHLQAHADAVAIAGLAAGLYALARTPDNDAVFKL